jgi:putative hemolysin
MIGPYKSSLIISAILLLGLVCVSLGFIKVHEADVAKRVAQISPTQTPTPTPDTSLLYMPSEAGSYCETNGGIIEIRKNFRGKEYGVCVFAPKDGVVGECEEQAFFQKYCPKGGYRIKSKVSDVVRYCVISGGEFQDEGIDENGVQKGNCYFFSNNKVCELNSMFWGSCGR